MRTGSTIAVVVWLNDGQSELCFLAVHLPSMALRAGSSPHSDPILLLHFPPREMQIVHEDPYFFFFLALLVAMCVESMRGKRVGLETFLC